MTGAGDTEAAGRGESRGEGRAESRGEGCVGVCVCVCVCAIRSVSFLFFSFIFFFFCREIVRRYKYIQTTAHASNNGGGAANDKGKDKSRSDRQTPAQTHPRENSTLLEEVCGDEGREPTTATSRNERDGGTVRAANMGSGHGSDTPSKAASGSLPDTRAAIQPEITS